MKIIGSKTILAGGLSALLLAAGCSQQPAEAPADDAATQTAAEVSNTDLIAANTAAGMNWFGGPVYNGEPALAVTAALVKAGGGAENFSFATALVAMLGEEAVNNEVAALNAKYGEDQVQNFIAGMDYAVKQALVRATEAGIALPPPADLQGADLARTLVEAGTVDGVFWSGYLFDKALSHDLHNIVMGDIESQRDAQTDLNVHKILNQAMYDVAQALGMQNVGLADLN